MSYRSLGAGLAADARRGALAASGAVAAAAVAELIATLVAYTGPLRAAAVLRLAALDATLFVIAWSLVAPLAILGFAAPRLVVAAVRGRAAARAWPGPGAAPIDPGTVARGWAWLAAAALFVWWSSRATFDASERYKEARLMGMLLALRQVAVGAALIGVAAIAGPLLARAQRWLDRRLGRARRVNPLGDPIAAAVVAAGAVLAAVLVTAHRLPQLRPLVPWRWMLLGAAAVAGGAATLAWLRRPRPAGARRDRRRRRRAALAVAVAVAVVVPATLIRWGGHVDAKGMAISASPAMSALIVVVRRANDFDGDGFGSLLGENDCAPRDPAIRPGARDIPDNGIDENCNGRDASMRDLVLPPGAGHPVPPAFQRDWNVLLLTIDTVRYDHTSFGGYVEAKGRDTTPRLAELVERSVSFTFANAPSAGTMASIPAILTSRFFHSGIALDEDVKPNMPPRLRPENVTLPEVMKRKGYTTGAILSHEYFNDWGMDQGVDEYDNEVGRTPDAFRVSSPQLTDRALAWVSRHAHGRWFLWVHYLDPHGRYVAHPSGPSWGRDEEALYDGELRFTDHHVGRLLDELARLPGADRTIVIITSDHGDGFGEHGFTNHGQALYRELIHVPLIIHVPDLPPRQVRGAVSPMDVLPTVADLVGIDVSDLRLEGRSLVPQLFGGPEDLGRVVFAETNWPRPLRAAVSERWKLIYDLQNHLYQLYKLDSDPWEQTNLASRDPQALADMKEHLDGWLERVMFDRDPLYNQAVMKLADVLLDRAPPLDGEVGDVRFDDGAIEVVGWDLVPAGRAARVAPGEKARVRVTFRVHRRPSGSFKLQVALWRTALDGFERSGRLGARVTRSGLETPADGYLPTDRWRPGELVRTSFEVTIPTDAGDDPDGYAVGLAISGASGRLAVDGPTAATEPHLAVLGAAAAPWAAPRLPRDPAEVRDEGGSAPAAP